MIQCIAADINRDQWNNLLLTSPVATWFQSPEAYDFFASMPDLMSPFVFAVYRHSPVETLQRNVSHSNDSRHRNFTVVSPQYHRSITVVSPNYQNNISDTPSTLVGLVVGYLTCDKSSIKQFFTRRAIIYGGPLLADDITSDELLALLTALQTHLSHKAIYIETRNFCDYSHWRDIFLKAGFLYQPHLNFHINTTSVDIAQSNIGKHRWKYIRLSMRDGATMVENPTIEQVREYYSILEELYKTKVHTPLYPWSFFERLYHLPSSHFLLVEYGGHIVGGTCCVSLAGKTLYEWFVCGNDNYHKGIRPSSVATWFGMKYAAEHSYPLFDLMGAGKPDEPYGVRDFKAEFGGTLVEHGRYLKINNKLLYYIGTIGVKLLKKTTSK